VAGLLHDGHVERTRVVSRLRTFAKPAHVDGADSLARAHRRWSPAPPPPPHADTKSQAREEIIKKPRTSTSTNRVRSSRCDGARYR